MGITTTQLTFTAGIISALGSDLVGADVRHPSFVTVTTAPLALLTMVPI